MKINLTQLEIVFFFIGEYKVKATAHASSAGLYRVCRQNSSLLRNSEIQVKPELHHTGRCHHTGKSKNSILTYVVERFNIVCRDVTDDTLKSR